MGGGGVLPFIALSEVFFIFVQGEKKKGDNKETSPLFKTVTVSFLHAGGKEGKRGRG